MNFGAHLRVFHVKFAIISNETLYANQFFLLVTQRLSSIKLHANEIADELHAAAQTDGIGSRLRSRKNQNPEISGLPKVNLRDPTRPTPGAVNCEAYTEGAKAQER